MPERSMEVNAAHLHLGADRCVDAAGMALTGAGRLAERVPESGIFGDFAEAHDFFGAVTAAHRDHVERLHDHHRALTEIGTKSRSGADQFTARDASSADLLRSTEAGFGSF